MPLICTKCAKEPHLKTLINNDGDSGECEICGEDGIVLSSKTNRFFQLCKALIRFNFSEWDYNDHWGPEGIYDLFEGEKNIFFYQERALSSEVYEELTTDIVKGNVYEEYDKGVSIYAGYSDGQQNQLLRSIKSTIDQNLIRISSRLATENHFLLENELKEILSRFHEITTTMVPAGQILYRARIGYSARKSNLDSGFETEYHYAAYGNEDIGAPPPFLASPGRANRAGVSFLYCATNESTAISEIRPHPGDRVSVGGFGLTKKLKAYDLSKSYLGSYFETDKLLDTYITLNTLRILINKTITPSERSQYSITQLIADCIRQLGFDAIMFESTVGTGTNFVVFSSADAKFIENRGGTYFINSVNYAFSKEPVINETSEYAEDVFAKRVR